MDDGVSTYFTRFGGNVFNSFDLWDPECYSSWLSHPVNDG